MLGNNVFMESLFPELERDAHTKRGKKSPHEKWLAQKRKNFGLEYCSNAIFSGKYGMPLLRSYQDTIPDYYTTFSNIDAIGDPNTCLTGFDYDYVLDRLWNTPEKYVDKISHYKCMAEPDYSLKVNHPLGLQIANTFRSHAISFFMQEHGIQILPTISWSSTPSYDFCFAGHSKGGVVLVSTIGTMKDERTRMYFQNGFFEMLKRISPDAVILYGDITEEIVSWMPSLLDIYHSEHNRFKRARNHGR